MNIIHAAIGILADSDGSVLVAQRPKDKICPGKWEFPGGKIESGESSRDALIREMKEELGVDVEVCEFLIQHINTFPDRHVYLDVWLVRQWQGIVHGVEDQPIKWLLPHEVNNLDFLPGSDAILPPLLQALQS